MALTTEQVAQLDAARTEFEAAQTALNDAGVEVAQNVVFRGTVDYEVAEDLEPTAVLTGVYEQGTPRAGQTWTIYTYTLSGNSASYGSAKLPKGTYRLVATQSKKNKTKGGMSWVKVA